MTETNKLKIISDVEGVGEITHEETLTVNTQTTVSIEFNFNSNTDKGSLVTKIGTKDKITETSTKPKVYQNADLYMSNVWSDSAAAYVTVKDLSVISTNPTSKISQCLKIAQKSRILHCERSELRLHFERTKFSRQKAYKAYIYFSAQNYHHNLQLQLWSYLA